MPTDDTNFEDELRDLMAAGRKIEAIKRYRAATGAGLADAKNAVKLWSGPNHCLQENPSIRLNWIALAESRNCAGALASSDNR